MVSIIIPNYNNATFLEDCLNSCINQNLDWVKEIIVIDDQSTDLSWSIIQDYKDRYPTLIKAFKNPKKGVQGARNYGFSKSSGKYIQWLDSDDVLSINKLSSQMKLLSNEDDSMISFCNWSGFNRDVSDAKPHRSSIWRNYSNPINFLINIWLKGQMLNPACWLIPRNLCESILWDTTIKKNQDGIYFFKFYSSLGFIFGLTLNLAILVSKLSITYLYSKRQKVFLTSSLL